MLSQRRKAREEDEKSVSLRASRFCDSTAFSWFNINWQLFSYRFLAQLALQGASVHTHGACGSRYIAIIIGQHLV